MAPGVLHCQAAQNEHMQAGNERPARVQRSCVGARRKLRTAGPAAGCSKRTYLSGGGFG
jgi:hypothetical protein